MSKIYEIDPEADTLVVVRPLAESFAPWPENDSNGPATPKNGLANGHGPADVRIKVSSKHLSLASPRFRDILAQKAAAAAVVQTNGVNGVNGKLSPNGTTTPPASPNSLWRRQVAASTSPTADESDGRIHIVLDGLDADATTTVLNIVHGRGGKDRVPKTVSLEALARIAVVVDKLKLQDAVEIYADRWVDELYRKGVPSQKDSRRDLVLWIYIAYVFERDQIFREATKIAATQLTGPLPNLPNLPLRAKIAHDIDLQRQEVIAQALDILEGAVDKLVQGGLDADEEITAEGEVTNSDTFLLGALLRTLHRNKIFWPRPAAPYKGVSIAAISRAAHDVQTQVWRTAFRIGDATRNNRTNNQLLLTPQLDNLRANVIVIAHRERERAFEGSEPGKEVNNGNEAENENEIEWDEGGAESVTELATDDGVDIDEVDVHENDNENDDDESTESDNEVTLVDDGSFALRQARPSFGASFEKSSEPLEEEGEGEDEPVLPGEAPDVVKVEKKPSTRTKLEDILAVVPVDHRLVVLDTKLDTPLDRALVSLSLCASLAVMDWGPHLLNLQPETWSTVHRARWAAVLLLLVWIPAVH